MGPAIERMSRTEVGWSGAKSPKASARARTRSLNTCPMSCRQDSRLSCGRVLQVTWLGTQRGATRPPAPQATGSSEIRPPAPVGSCAADGARGGSAGFSMPEHALTPIHTYLAKKGSRVLRPHVPSRSRLRTGPRCRGRARSDREHPHPRAPGQAARAPPRGQRAPVVPPRRRPPPRPRASRAASSWRKKNMRTQAGGGGGHPRGRAPAARRLIATARAAGQWGPGAGRAGGRACRRARQVPSPLRAPCPHGPARLRTRARACRSHCWSHPRIFCGAHANF